MNEINPAIQKIARGTGIVFAGTVISMLLQFLSRAIIARCFSTGEYGVFNLALTILNIALVIVTLGFQNTLPREVAFYREKEPSRIEDLISTALAIVVVNSVIWTTILFASAGNISKFFGDEMLARALRIIVFALPSWALIIVIISISRGFSRVREQVYFQNIVYPILFMVFVIVGVFLKFPFVFVFVVYVVVQAFVLLVLIFYIQKKEIFKLKIFLNLKLGKELITFSFPLLFSGILAFVMNWTDTLMLGYYNSSNIVGLYNAAAPIAKLIPIFLNSVGFLYAPIATQLYAQRKLKELKRIYMILTKWIFLLTLPIFSMMLLFPEVIIYLFFGTKYISATPVLQILALGFMFHTFLGLNGMSLIVIGDTKANLIANIFAALSNVILNTLLIPAYGIIGAAVSTTISYFVVNMFRSLWLYKRTKIHPFSWNYIKMLSISFVLLVIVRELNLKVSTIWHAIPILMVFLVVYSFLILLSKSIDKEDVKLFLAVEKKLRLEVKIIKKTLRKFV